MLSGYTPEESLMCIEGYVYKTQHNSVKAEPSG